ncbi:MAG TPA: DUF5654 family protein [Candidatus Paceibacterota bacterium]|nr:DUF5654 family protein [Candidatus Paceibacterota bacterium]
MKGRARDNVIRSSVVTAFTIAIALVWKDVFERAIDIWIPRGDALYTHFFAAVLVTGLVVIAIKVFVLTEEQAEEALEELGRRLNHTNGHGKQGNGRPRTPKKHPPADNGI